MAEVFHENPESVITDPYLLEEADYLKQQGRWKNKQRTLIFSSRGIPSRYRHLMEDLKTMLPHHFSESKWEKQQTLSDINEVAESKSCNNCIFFDCRKMKELYMWIARTPNGPSAKFQVLNVHTMGEMKMTGNYLNGSRPLLTFDSAFDSEPHLRLLRDMFIQTMGTPRYHPKSKPFYDHVMSFMYSDNKIWFRHYQIVPETDDSANKAEEQRLIEIGPRFVLEPIKIFDQSFSGQTIYSNPNYETPAQVRTRMSAVRGSKFVNRVSATVRREDHVKRTAMKPDELDDAYMYSEDEESEMEIDESD